MTTDKISRDQGSELQNETCPPGTEEEANISHPQLRTRRLCPTSFF
jgi:hypothetical protein